MDNNNNRMEYNIEESQRRKERQEKVDQVKKKVSGFVDRIKEEWEDRKRAKEEAARVKAAEKAEKEAAAVSQAREDSERQAVREAFVPSNGGFSEATVTNATISKPSLGKKSKVELTPQEKSRLSRKRKKLIRNIMTIPEIILIVYLALFLKDKYINYSEDVHQTLTYTAGSYVYEIHRDNQAVKVIKNLRGECAKAPCELEKISEYEVKFGKNQMTALRVFMDIKMKFKSTSKTITIDDIKTDFGKKCIYAIIHNNDYFLGFSSYNKFQTVEFEQKGRFAKKGYKYETLAGQNTLYISLGEKPTSGYAIAVSSVYKKGDDLYFYIQEQSPQEGEELSSIITHPMIQLALEGAPKNIYVYDLETGEEFPNMDAPALPNPEPSMVQNRKVMSGIVGDLVGALREEALKD